MKKYKLGIGFGSLNPLHYGHIWLFQKAKALCETFVVGLDTDAFLTKVKGKDLLQDYKTRHALLAELKCVDMIVPQSVECDKKFWIQTLGCDAIFVGDDHQNTNWEGEKIAKECGISVVYLPHTVEIHSKQIRDIIKMGKMK